MSKIKRLEKMHFEKWEYDLVKIQGHFLDQYFIIERAKGVRNGYNILKPLQLDSDQVVLVNLGWLPESEFSNIEKYQKISQSQKQTITGLLKRSEHTQVKPDYLEFQNQGKINRIIDLDQISKKLNPFKNYKKFYIEKIISDDEIIQDMYPFPSSRMSYQGPYLTPRKHQEYAVFWGCTAMIGFSSILILLKKQLIYNMNLQKFWLLTILMLTVSLEKDKENQDPLLLDPNDQTIVEDLEQKQTDSSINPEAVLEKQSQIKPWENNTEAELKQNEFVEGQNTEPIKGSCNLDLLEQFGINVSDENKSAQRPFQASALVKSYCRRNVNSCCYGEEIMQLEKHFTKSKKELEQKFQPFQEMIVLFKGNKYEDVLFQVQQKEECQQILLNSPLYKSAHNEDHFMNTILPTEIDRMLSLLTDSEMYVKKAYWFYGNMICVICNPNQVQYIHLEGENPYVEYNVNNCSESIEMSEFENRAIMAYEFFFKTWVHLSQCLTGSYKDDDFKVPDLDIQNINEDIQKYSKCYKEFDFSSEECKKLCSSRRFDSYEFPIKFFQATVQALKNIFPVFTEVSLEEFYDKTKHRNPDEFAKDEPISFFEGFKGGKLNEAKIKIDETKGIFVYQNQISKKFYSFVEKKKTKGDMIYTVLQMLLIFWL